MVDYWVSRERHYCKYCNVWMHIDKLSIKHHEQGRKHKDKIQETLKLKRQAKSDAANAQKEVYEQIKLIEEEAQVKYDQDMAIRGMRPPPPPRFGKSNAAPPPPRQSSVKTPILSSNTRKQLHEVYYCPHIEPKEVDEEKQEEDNGVYAVRGNVYLEGKKHETQLEGGSACQIWVEKTEQWLDALVEQATVHTVPNTDMSFRRFTIMYMLPPSEESVKNGDNKPTPVTEREVLADRLRIPLPTNMTLETAGKMVETWRNGGTVEAAPRAPVVVDETTGMGEWSTVEVRQIDESPEAIAKCAEDAEAKATRLAEEQNKIDTLDDYSTQGDNALGAFNPWGGTYKGVNLEDAADATADGSLPCTQVTRREQEINITTKGNIRFKKRGQKKQKRRRIHMDDD
ncbi:unnamed protein product [Peronospora belbahrii]|uniref:Matrin-type domain-containing protein n=1 Tax=Peronospora belbahrii TaxID=622444 RepID=A0AAU9KXE2_9STRA|nr:unnamed protein product [Peronospora belbahrii]